MSEDAECEKWGAIGRRLSDLRGASTQMEMARQLAVSKSTYSRLERGARELGADVLIRLEAMGWNPRWVVSGKGPARCNGDSDGGREDFQMETSRLAVAIELADDVVADQWLPTGAYAVLVGRLYQAVLEQANWNELHGIAQTTLTMLRADPPSC